MPHEFSVPLAPAATAGQTIGLTTARHYPARHDVARQNSAREAGPARLLVFGHGAGAGHDHPWMSRYAEAFAEAGLDVVTFNFPYIERGRRLPDRTPVLEACFRAVVASARALPGLGDVALFLAGKSMGGRMATHLATDPPAGARGVVSFGYPLHPPGRPDQLRTAHLSSLVLPWLVVQGERDTFGTPAELDPALALAGREATLHVVDRGDHSLLVRGVPIETVRATVTGWVDAWTAARA